MGHLPMLLDTEKSGNDHHVTHEKQTRIDQNHDAQTDSSSSNDIAPHFPISKH